MGEGTVGDRLVEALLGAGVRHVFGVPGDYVLGLSARLERGLNLVTTCDEQGAGFAADAYARLHGLGCAVVTYGVGGLKMVNAAAQAWAERSPLVIVSGAPGVAERRAEPLLHHRVKGFDTQRRVMDEVCAHSAVLEDPGSAPAQIAAALDIARRLRRPVYVEVPRDVERAPAPPLPPPPPAPPGPDAAELAEALDEVAGLIARAERPVAVVGVGVSRLGLSGRVTTLARRIGMPMATTMLGKSAVSEHEADSLGVYIGGMGRPEVAAAVEQADLLMLLGARLTDLNTGMFTAHIDPARTVSADIDDLHVRRHVYPRVGLADVVDGLLARDLPGHTVERAVPAGPPPFRPEAGAALSNARLFACLAAQVDDSVTVIAEAGDALFGAADLPVGEDGFLGSAYYASLGFAVPAAMGAALARPERRPLVLVGDGAFQMTGVELSVAREAGTAPVVVVLNNGGYGTERPMLDGRFNDIPAWDYVRFTEAIGAGSAVACDTEAAFDAALGRALADPGQVHLIEARIPSGDISPALRRLTAALGRRVTAAE